MWGETGAGACVSDPPIRVAESPPIRIDCRPELNAAAEIYLAQAKGVLGMNHGVPIRSGFGKPDCSEQQRIEGSRI
jgi:hypothetical protein